MPLDVRRLAPALGAEVFGFAATTTPSVDTGRIIEELIAEHQVVVLRDQHLDPGALVDFASALGEPTVHPLVPHLDGYPAVQEIKNYGKNVTLNEHWHTDVSFAEEPPKYTVLHARTVPEIGGDTQFANQYLAYEALSPALQAVLGGLRAEHRGDGLALAMGRDVADAPSALHPVTRLHPVTGRRALYVCAAFTRRFEGWSPQESAGLLRTLFELGSRPDFTFRHRWSTGDLVVWDNRCVLHYAIHDHDGADRTLHRVTVRGEVPV